MKNNVKYEESLEYFAKINKKEYLLKEFSSRNIKNPSEIFRGTSDVYWWNCPDCGSEYDMKVCNRTRIKASKCPFCRGLRVNHTNCLWTTHHHIAELLLNSQSGYKVTHGSHKKEKFKCPDCGENFNKNISEVVRRGFKCKVCSDGISYPEKFMINLLSQINLKYETHKTFNWSKNIITKNKKLCGNKSYDFYIESLNMIIETHGKQHYENTGYDKIGGRNFNEEQENDCLKEQLAITNGVKRYIVVNCMNSDLEWISNSVLNSELNNMFDLSNIDWLKCHEFACNNLLKFVCDLWSDGVKNVKEIAILTNLDRTTVLKYLKKGVKINLCDYDPKAEMKISGYNSSQRRMKKVIQLTLNNEFIKEWDSARHITNDLGICYKKVSSVCNGSRNSAEGFKWVFKDDYDKFIDTGIIPTRNNKKEVICLNTLEVYKGVREAGRSINRSHQNITACILGKTNSCGIDSDTGESLRWMYKEDYDKHTKNKIIN